MNRYFFIFIFIFLFLFLCVIRFQVAGGDPALWINPINRPPNENYYLSHYDIHTDHSILYHGIGKAISYAQKADVLILGSSQVQQGLRDFFTSECQRRWNIKVYNMGLGYGEQLPFQYAIIDKHHLRPKFVIVGIEGLQRDHPSEQGEKILKETFFQAFQQIFFHYNKARLDIILHSILPSRAFYFLPELAVERGFAWTSIQTGCWYSKKFPIIGKPITKINQIDIGMEIAGGKIAPERMTETNLRKNIDTNVGKNFLKNAMVLKKEMDRIGAKIILIDVPCDNFYPELVPFLAQQLKVPYISTDWKPYETFDGIHLITSSSKKYSEEILEGLEKLGILKNPDNK